MLATFGYDDLGRRTSLSRINGTGTSYGYDAVGRLASLAHNFAGTANDVTFTYAYNPASQIASRTANNDAYSYSSIANQNVTDTHNGLNQIVTAGLTAFTHDGRGNTTAIGSSSFVYTADNRLLSAAGDVYIYDALGRLIYDHYRDNLYDPATGQLTAEKVANGGPLTHLYVLGPGTDEPLMDYSFAAGTLTQLHADERGSIIAATDSSGNVTAINRYDDYGAPQECGATVAGPVRSGRRLRRVPRLLRSFAAMRGQLVEVRWGIAAPRFKSAPSFQRSSFSPCASSFPSPS